MKKIYLAGRWQRQHELNEKAKEIDTLENYTVNSRWLVWHTNETDHSIAAIVDVEDVSSCDIFVLLTETPVVGYNTGGRHFETGLAFAKEKEIILVGPKENIFHYLPGVKQFNSWGGLMVYLQSR